MASDETPSYLILGASGGIGSALARRLRAAGAHLLLAARDESRLESLAAELAAPFVALDARRPEAVASACGAAIEAHGRLDGVANCVGSILLKPAHGTTFEEWDDAVSTNLGSAFATVHAAGRTLRKTGGSVVLVSSAAASTGMANHEAIAAAKAGVEGLTRSAAATYAPFGLRVNAVAPGLVRTPLTAALTKTEAQVEASAALHALGRIGEPEDIAAAIAWLLDSAQSWITGQVVGVDGGLARIRARHA